MSNWSLVLRHFFCYSQLRKEKRVNVCQLFDALAQCGADAMACAGAGAQQNRIFRFVRGKQPRCHFARMIWRNASVVCASRHQDRRILRPIGDVVIRRVGVKRLELLRIFNRAELGHVERAVRRQFHAQHVVNAHRGYHCRNKSACCVIIAPIRSPPLLPP